MSPYDIACIRNFISELRGYIRHGGEPPVIPPIEDIELMDAFGEIAECVIIAVTRRKEKKK